jgi:hypothetical protein
VAVCIEVARRYADGTIARAKVYRGAKAAHPIAQHHRNVVGVHVRRGQVEFAVPVEVTRRHGNRIDDGKVHRRGKATHPVAEQHGDMVGYAVRRYQVELTVRVEVPRSHGDRSIACTEIHCGGKATRPVAQQD